MNEKLQIDSRALMREIARYLAAVDAFRAESLEPTWLPEPVFREIALEHARVRAERAPSAH